MVDVLLKDNDSLRKALSAATREKAGLGRAAARLERTLTQHVLKGCALSVRAPAPGGGCGLGHGDPGFSGGRGGAVLADTQSRCLDAAADFLLCSQTRPRAPSLPHMAQARVRGAKRCPRGSGS